MYDPAHEHDACGVGFVVNIRGEKSHQIVRSGLEILVNLTHRGACGCDPLTGDGAGILTQMPHEFFAAKATEAGCRTAAARRLRRRHGLSAADRGRTPLVPGAAGSDRRRRRADVLGWRDVPVDNAVLGRTARDVEPFIRQVFIGRGKQTPRSTCCEWKLYVIRKRLEADVRASQLEQKQYCYVPSLSSRVIIYKGLLLADQVERFYHDLADERFISALALVHQRVQHQHVPDLGPGPSVPLSGPQRRDQHAQGQRQLDARPGELAGPSGLRSRHQEDLPGLRARGQRLGGVRQRARAVGADRPFAAAGDVDARSRAVAEPRDDARRSEGLLRISGLFDRALGRAGLDGLYRRHADGGRARPQRSAAQPLLGDQGRRWS